MVCTSTRHQILIVAASKATASELCRADFLAASMGNPPFDRPLRTIRPWMLAPQQQQQQLHYDITTTTTKFCRKTSARLRRLALLDASRCGYQTLMDWET
ncbi:hypothetical protein M419DRAFT_124000 [Trichoderma reesei RUT C-30]|uniref:Uncharacterized protein n=1 Tax=Hypocrea jecorina (strain ATCC 56765 / BCRC 32924 / NRRL 11460 / Rut C-30) TaxID=1344414 RepID=A0A024S503_HYPJR|nr:hypothetical protein M419DRAFT_124000 [Trichoderma reesei RUT C-30]